MRRLLAFLLILAPASVLAQTPAFEGCEGSGCTATGGRGGTVIKVTNTNDSGAGSLREALTTAGARFIVFETCGTIALQSGILVNSPDFTVAGQTACGDGIQLNGAAHQLYNLRIDTDNGIVRFIRSRKGGATGSQDGDAIVVTANEAQSGIVWANSSFFWTGDENVAVENSLDGGIDGVTIQENIVAEPLAIHPTNVGSFASTDSEKAGLDNVDLIKNYLTDSSHRNPLLQGETARIVNNIIYNWALKAIQIDGGNTATVSPTVDVVNNALYGGPLDTSPSHELVAFMPGGVTSSIYFEGNFGPNHPDPTTDGWADMTADNTATGAVNNDTTTDLDEGTHRRLTPLAAPTHPIDTWPAKSLVERVLPTVGASRVLDCDGSWRFVRDSADDRVVQDYIDGTGIIPESEADVGGFPTIATTPAACTDTDGDGAPDEFENLIGSDPNVSDPWVDADADGWGVLEEYTNGPSDCDLVAESDPVPSGYGHPYDPNVQYRRHVQVQCSDALAQIIVGTGWDEIFVYDTAYTTSGGVWDTGSPVSLTGPNPSGSYFIGRAWATLPQTGAALDTDQFVAAFVCTWDGASYDCGCRDAACATPQWQVQKFNRSG